MIIKGSYPFVLFTNFIFIKTEQTYLFVKFLAKNNRLSSFIAQAVILKRYKYACFLFII